jgi:hypothetical protein
MLPTSFIKFKSDVIFCCKQQAVKKRIVQIGAKKLKGFINRMETLISSVLYLALERLKTSFSSSTDVHRCFQFSITNGF